MSGTKNKSGGARPGAGGIPTDSPATIGKFSPQARQELRILYLSQKAIRGPRFSQRQLIEEWIHEKWLEYDEHTQNIEGEMNMTKATAVFDNSDLIEKGAYVDPTSTVEFSGPGWYALSEDFNWIKVSSHTKERGFTLDEAERTDYVGSPYWLGSLAEVEQWMYQ